MHYIHARLIGAVGPPQVAAGHEGGGQEGVLRAAQAAVELHRPVHDALRHAGHHGLHQRQQLPRVVVLVAQPVHAIRGLPHQQARLTEGAERYIDCTFVIESIM